MLAVAVTGSRRWTDRLAITSALEALEPFLAVVIEGGAPGADRIAGQWAAQARYRGIGWVRFPADWKTYGKAAGPRRNAEMVAWLLGAEDRCDWQPYYLAFPLPDSKGTWDMVDQCLASGIKGIICA